MSTALVLSGGGPLAVAWESGFVAGAARSGVTLASVDFILGTSAGAIVGAQLAGGCDPQAMVAAILNETGGAVRTDLPPHLVAAMRKLPELFARSQSGDAGRLEVGSYAAAATGLETEIAYVDRIRRHIGVGEWPDAPLGVVAVDVADGATRILTRGCGATIAAAVAASCGLPGVSPPVTIAGRRYIDGGMRSAANADLASGFESTLVLSFQPPGQAGARMNARLASEVEALTAAGTRVCVMSPDVASLAAIGPHAMDVSRRPDIVRAGIAQGANAADSIATFRAGARPPG